MNPWDTPYFHKEKARRIQTCRTPVELEGSDRFCPKILPATLASKIVPFLSFPFFSFCLYVRMCICIYVKGWNSTSLEPRDIVEWYLFRGKLGSAREEREPHGKWVKARAGKRQLIPTTQQKPPDIPSQSSLANPQHNTTRSLNHW